MKIAKWAYGKFLMMLMAVFVLEACQTNEKMKTVNVTTIEHLEVSRFMGTWFEIARYDHRFEKGMSEVRADYTLLPNGNIKVVNSGMKNGKRKEIIGKARQKKGKRAGELEVSFFLCFYSDYNILETDEEYNYAVIGGSSGKYLWILSRSPKIEGAVLDKLMTKIEKRGYDTTALIFVSQK